MSLDMPWLILPVIFFAYLVRGVTGFGSALITVPILALFYPLTFLVPMIMTLDFVASFILGGVDRRKTAWSEIVLLLPFGLIGALFGVYLLLQFPAPAILVALGAFTIYFGIRNVLGVKPEGSISKLWAIPAGIIGSGGGALFGTSGPSYIIYLTHRLEDKTTVRATFSWLFVIDSSVRLTLFALAGLLFKTDTILAIGIGFVPMMLGIYVGNKIHFQLTRELLLKMVGILLIVSGCVLVLKTVITRVAS